MGDPGKAWGDASGWGGSLGYNHTPAVGSVAWWQGGDHVAYVEQVSADGSQVFVTADNYVTTGSGGYTDSGWISVNSPTGFLHPHDAPSARQSGYQATFQANTGSAYAWGDKANGDLQQGLAPGTSPAVALLPNGGYEVAFQANTGNLFVYGDAGGGDTHQGMQRGTSPSIAASPRGGFRVAFQANNGALYQYDSNTGAATNLDQGMASNTSPAIAALAKSGYEIAFQANTGNLFVYGDAGGGDTRQGMQARSNPSIAASPRGGFRVAFQANTGSLYQYDSNTGAATNLNQGMASNTSPAIAALANSGYEIAFQANTGNLFVYGDAGGGDTHQGMQNATSPAVAGSTSGGFRVLFQANTHSLYEYDSVAASATDLQLGMNPSTGPCVASGIGSSCGESVFGAPNAPPAPHANPLDGAAQLTWNAPSDDGGLPVNGYTVTATPGGATTTVPGDARAATLGGLTNGQTYTFTLRAANIIGASPESGSSNPVAPQGQVQESTNTSLLSSASSVVGQKVVFSARVSSADKSMPTGTVVFTVDGTPSAPVTVNKGKATLTITSLHAGDHQITASYNGDTSHRASTSTLTTQTVDQANTITKVTTTGTGKSLKATATATVVPVSPGAGVPSGSITFVVDGTTTTAPLSRGKATVKLGAGTHTVTATYPGTTDYATSTGSL